MEGHMNSIEVMREFLGWCAVINVGLLLLATIKLVLFRDLFSSIYDKMFNIDKSDLSRAYIQFLAQFKIVVLVFSIVPYFALLIMS